MFPAGGIGRGLHNLRQQLMGDGLIGEFADASASFDTFVGCHKNPPAMRTVPLCFLAYYSISTAGKQ